MSTIAFIGLGIMGGPMAAHLVRAGHTVLGVNRSPAAVQRLVEAGGRDGGGVAAAVREADVVVTMVPDSPDVESLALGGRGPPTPGRDAAPRHVHDPARRPSRSLRRAPRPASGSSTPRSAAGRRGAGGDPLDHGRRGRGGVEAARPLLEVVGRTVVHVGPAGAGQTVKAANQLVVAGTYQLLAEAIVFLRAHGVDDEAALRVLAGGLAGSAVLDRKGASMVGGTSSPGSASTCTTRISASSPPPPGSRASPCPSAR